MTAPFEPGDAARLEDGGILLFGQLRVTCQRCVTPPEHFYHNPPRSLGMLPVGKSADGDFHVPLAADEAFWLGLTIPAAMMSFRLFVETKRHGHLNARTGRPVEEDDASEFVVSEHSAIYGIHRDTQSWWPFQRMPHAAMPACLRLSFSLGTDASVLETSEPLKPSLRLVSYEEFTRQTGLPAPTPMDPTASYGGWLLP